MSDKQIAVIGGTFAALGVMAEKREQTVLIERTGLLGKEFINSFYPGSEWMETKISEATKWLKDDYVKRKVLSNDGRVHLAGMAPSLYQHMKENEFLIKLLTEIIQVVPKESGFEISIFNASGKSTIYADVVIDTSARALSTFGKHAKIKRKAVNALLYFEGEKATVDIDFLRQHAPDCTDIFPTVIQNLAVLSIPVDVGTDWPEARMKIHQAWSSRSLELSQWTISAVAFEFMYDTEKGPWEVMPGWICLSSSAYRNPLEAYEAGVHVV
jgi:hypothetical protein